MELMDAFNETKQALYDHVGFKEDWVVYAIEDRTDVFWKIGDGVVSFSEDEDDIDDRYVDEIYTQRFYKKHVFEGKDMTMVMVDTHTDGNKFFAFFDNAKRIK